MVTGFRIGTIDMISAAKPKAELDSPRVEVDRPQIEVHRSQVKADSLKIASLVPILTPVTI